MKLPITIMVNGVSSKVDTYFSAGRNIPRFLPSVLEPKGSRDSAVGIATDYELDDRGVEFESR
jgi:hypothetical protein